MAFYAAKYVFKKMKKIILEWLHNSTNLVG